MTLERGRISVLLSSVGAVLAIAVVLSVTARSTMPSSGPVYDDAFWRVWGDGKAEVSSYDLVYPRYGNPGKGLAITIFVTEPFSDSLRVKADAGRHSSSDVFPAMKLNLIQDFQTGVYDYNEETSSFVGLAPAGGRPAGSLCKVSFSSQEWCGHTWLQVLPRMDRYEIAGHSYFDGEADRRANLPAPAGGVSEDQLMFWVRGIGQPLLEPGQTAEVPYLPSLQSSRHHHRQLTWTRARLTREAGAREISTPAGKFNVEVYRTEIESGGSRAYYVDLAAPRRVVRWESSDGERGDLIASKRMKYWTMNQPGGEGVLKELGLSQRAPRTP